MQHISIKKFFLIFVAILVALSGTAVFFFYYGIPIHDINLWRLQKAFAMANIRHPEQSALIKEKTYLGGPNEHGSRECVYAVGEMATTPLSKKEITETFKNINVVFSDEKLPVNVLFSGQRIPYEMPFVAWKEELTNATARGNTPYIVYITTKRSFLGDPRCDD